MANKLFPISIIVLTDRNDERFLHCLASTQWADEVLIGDNLSHNRWNELRKNHHFSIVKCEKIIDFSFFRNQLMHQVKHEWILFLDSDEVVSNELKTEIVEKISQTNTDSFYIKRKDYFLGKVLQYGEVGHVKILRFMKKHSGQWQGRVHEVFVVKDEKVGHLSSPLLHYPHQSMHSFISKINFYSTLRAKELTSPSKLYIVIELMLKPIGKFIYNYFLQLGFLDGWRGLVYASVMSLHSLSVRIKVYEKNKSRILNHESSIINH